MRRASFVLIVAAVTVSLAAAQSTPPPSPVSQAIRNAWDGAKGNITASADLMPEAGYSFKPLDTVKTFGQIVAHIAGENYAFCAPAKGEKSPHAGDEFEKSATTKAEIIMALNQSLAYCDAAFAALDDKSAGEMIGEARDPFARVGPLLGNIGHLNQHYGNLVTYFRIKGMVPPSSMPRP